MLTIEFHGEEGFTDFSATSAPLVPAALRDRRARAAPGQGVPRVRLDVERHWGKNRIEFDAAGEAGRPDGGIRQIEEHRGAVEIDRSTGTLTSTNALRYAEDLHTGRR